jgi:hypothetical protein
MSHGSDPGISQPPLDAKTQSQIINQNIVINYFGN